MNKSILHNMIATEDLFINDLVKVVENKYIVKLSKSELLQPLPRETVYVPIENISQYQKGTIINDNAVFIVEI